MVHGHWLKSMIQIHDDCVESKYFNALKNEIFDFKHMPWFLSQYTAYKQKSTDTDDFSFSHLAIKNSNNISELAPYARMCINEAFKNLGKSEPEILRVRFGLILKSHKHKVHGPHVDHHYPHQTGLLYLNDSDGDTYFYDNYYEPESNMKNLHQFEYYEKYVKDKLKFQQSITPKNNRLVLFNGYQYHASSCPTNTPLRVVMNFNIAYDKSL
jgi:hypothetical protein